MGRLTGAVQLQSPQRLNLRKGLIRAYRGAKRQRRNLFEALASPRYSRPALHDLDRKLEPYLPETGIFVEAGAADGYRKSNTYFLERWRGWSGVLVEAVPELAELCRRDRPRSRVYNCALVGPEEAGRVIRVRLADLMSSVIRSEDSALTEVPRVPEPLTTVKDPGHTALVGGTTLSHILADANIDHVDFLSLDVEGYEADVLRGLDFSQCAPRWMLIEILDLDARRMMVEKELKGMYELVDLLTPTDALYRLRPR